MLLLYSHVHVYVHISTHCFCINYYIRMYLPHYLHNVSYSTRVWALWPKIASTHCWLDKHSCKVSVGVYLVVDVMWCVLLSLFVRCGCHLSCLLIVRKVLEYHCPLTFPHKGLLIQYFLFFGGASFGESPYSTYLVKVSITCLCKWCVCALADLMAPHMPCVMDCGDMWDWVCNYEAMFVLV